MTEFTNACTMVGKARAGMICSAWISPMRMPVHFAVIWSRCALKFKWVSMMRFFTTLESGMTVPITFIVTCGIPRIRAGVPRTRTCVFDPLSFIRLAQNHVYRPSTARSMRSMICDRSHFLPLTRSCVSSANWATRTFSGRYRHMSFENMCLSRGGGRGLPYPRWFFFSLHPTRFSILGQIWYICIPSCVFIFSPGRQKIQVCFFLMRYDLLQVMSGRIFASFDIMPKAQLWSKHFELQSALRTYRTLRAAGFAKGFANILLLWSFLSGVQSDNERKALAHKIHLRRTDSVVVNDVTNPTFIRNLGKRRVSFKKYNFLKFPTLPVSGMCLTFWHTIKA